MRTFEELLVGYILVRRVSVWLQPSFSKSLQCNFPGCPEYFVVAIDCMAELSTLLALHFSEI